MKKNIILLVVIVLFLGIAYFFFFPNRVGDDESNEQIEEKEDISNQEEVELDKTKPVYDDTYLKEDDLFHEYYDKAYEKMQNMTLEEKVGQMFFVRYNSKVTSEIKNLSPGGYILFAVDFENETKSSIKKKLESNQKISKIPLAFGVDEEGGTVTRVSRFKQFRSSKFKSPQELYRIGGFEKIVSETKEKDTLLKSLGLNVNLAPVVDVSTNKNDFIYNRSFGKNATLTSKFASQVVNAMNKDNLSSVLKHFPGYGNNVDTHTGIAIDKRSAENFDKNDFLPFISGIEAKAPMILVSHNIVQAFDSKYPASLSKEVHQVLRDKLNFSGISVTDDLAMDGVKKYTDNNSASTLAVLAGNDFIITSDFETQKNEVLQAVKNKKIDQKLIDTAVVRILAWKMAYKIIDD